MPDILRAPWTPEQVKMLNTWQTEMAFHGFTCADRDHPGEDLMVATTEGWVCPTCSLTQDWAWAWMVDPELMKRNRAFLAGLAAHHRGINEPREEEIED